MAVSINTSGTYSVTRVDSADTATGWSVVKLEGGGGAPSLLASVGTIDLVAEGTDARAARTNKQRVQILFTNAGGYDFTSSSTGTGATKVPSGIAYVWALFLAAGSLFTKSAGGMQVSLGDGTNTSFWNVAGSDDYTGGFRKWAVYTGIAPSETSGTAANLGDITEIGFVTDVGAATTRFDNFVVDAMDVGLGLTLQGTTTGDALFAESTAQDEATAIGILSNENGIFFCQGNLEFSGTALTSNAEVLVFTDTLGGAYTYQLDVTGTVTLTNSAIQTSGAVNFNVDTSSASAFSMTGGSISGFNSLTTGASQSVSGVVFQSGGTSAIANTVNDSTFNQCGLITLTGNLVGCTINESTSAASVSCDNLSKVDDCTFISDGSNHAVDLGTVSAATTMSWSCNESGYTAASSGNETILVNYTDTGAPLIISVQAGASTPSVRNTGAGTVDVQAGLITVEVIVRESTGGTLLSGARVYLHEDGNTSNVYLNAETDGTGRVSTDISFTAITDVVGWVRQWDLSGVDYTPKDISGQITSSGLTINVVLDPAN